MLMRIQRVVAQRIRGLYAGWSNSSEMVRPVCIVLLFLLCEGCARPPAHEPVTLTLLGEWSSRTFTEERQLELQQFTEETGIRVSFIPGPESSWQRVLLWRELLETGAPGPDVYDMDVIWPGTLAEYFLDLKPYFSNEISAQFPATAAAYTVDHKLGPCRIAPTSGFCTIAPIFSDSMDIVSHPGHGMIWRLWQLEFKRASEPRGRKSFGALCGKGRLMKG